MLPSSTHLLRGQAPGAVLRAVGARETRAAGRARETRAASLQPRPQAEADTAEAVHTARTAVQGATGRRPARRWLSLATGALPWEPDNGREQSCLCQR